MAEFRRFKSEQTKQPYIAALSGCRMVMNRLIVALFLVCSALGISCSSDPEPFNCDNSDLVLHLGTTTNASACNIADGSISVHVAGGKEPYAFSINDLPSQSNGNFTSLHAGIYAVKVTDAHACETRLDNINISVPGFTVVTDITPDTQCLGGGGTVVINIGDGNSPPYQYSKGSEGFSDNNTFTGLQEGVHQFTVKDNSGCTIQLALTIPYGNSGTSWTNEILAIIKTKCATSGCHDGQFRPDLRIYDKAFFYRNLIKQYTQDGSMPFDGPRLPQEQIDLISCWVNDGAPQN